MDDQAISGHAFQQSARLSRDCLARQVAHRDDNLDAIESERFEAEVCNYTNTSRSNSLLLSRLTDPIPEIAECVLLVDLVQTGAAEKFSPRLRKYAELECSLIAQALVAFREPVKRISMGV